MPEVHRSCPFCKDKLPEFVFIHHMKNTHDWNEVDFKKTSLMTIVRRDPSKFGGAVKNLSERWKCPKCDFSSNKGNAVSHQRREQHLGELIKMEM